MLTMGRTNPLDRQAGGRSCIFARISTLEGSPDQVDEGLRHVREQVLPLMQQQDGFKGFIALSDRQSGKVIGVSLWESEQAMRASEEAGDVPAATQRRSLARRRWA
jgi:heme-degrading monooxygenase HmoA